MHAPTSEHRNLECSARWQSYWDDVAVLLPEDPYWLLRQACGSGGSVESSLRSTVVYLSSPADLQFIRTGSQPFDTLTGISLGGSCYGSLAVDR